MTPTNIIEHKIEHIAPAGSDPVSRFEAGQTTPFESVSLIANHLIDVTFDFKSQKIAAEIYERCSKQTHSERGSDGLLRLIPNELVERVPLKAIVVGACVAGTRERHGKALETATLNVQLFQRLKDASGDQKEVRQIAGDLFMDADDFAAVIEMEVPSKPVAAALEWLVDYNQKNKSAWKLHCDKLPPPVDPKTDFAAAVGAGVVAALKELGLTKPGGKATA